MNEFKDYRSSLIVIRHEGFLDPFDLPIGRSYPVKGKRCKDTETVTFDLVSLSHYQGER